MARLSRLSSTFRTVVLAATVVFLAGCDDPFSPYWDRGTYYLSYANNRPVPTAVSRDGYGNPRTEVLGGTLTLRRDHSYQMVVDIREWSPAGRPYDSSIVFAGVYENEHRTLYLTWYGARDFYGNVMVANWRNGRVEVVVPDVDDGFGVLCLFDE
jgi:hypothetical protein